jgi:hypothetical protein
MLLQTDHALYLSRLATLAATVPNTFVFHRFLIKVVNCEIRKLSSYYFIKAIHNKIQSHNHDVMALKSSQYGPLITRLSLFLDTSKNNIKLLFFIIIFRNAYHPNL